MNSFFLPSTPTPCPSPQGEREARVLPPSLRGGAGGGGRRAMPSLLLVSFLSMAAAPSLAADRQLTGPEIAALLPKIAAIGDDDRQVFAANGETVFSKAAEDRFGRWEIRGDRYCSLFPPSTDWICRAVHAEGPDNALPTRLTWIGDDGKPLKKIVRRKDAQP